jgi:sec-independent protein translocase protein TatB
MFDIGWGELVVIGVVALIAIGPKELPGVLRSLGQWAGKIRRMSAEFQGQFREALREAEMDDLKKQAEEAQSAMVDFTNFDPMATPEKPSEESTPDTAPAADNEIHVADALPAPQEQKSDEPTSEPPTVVTESDAAETSAPSKTAGSGA